MGKGGGGLANGRGGQAKFYSLIWEGQKGFTLRKRGGKKSLMVCILLCSAF